MPQPRPIALPAALLLATASLASTVAVACAFLLVAVVLVAGHPEVVLNDGAWAPWCEAAACACATVAALIALTRTCGGLRPPALACTWALAFAWPLWGAPPAAVAATLATAFVVRWGAAGARPRRFDAPLAALLAALALVLLGAAFGGAPATDRAPAPDTRAGDARGDREPGTDAARTDGAPTGSTDGARADGGAELLRGSSARTAASPAAVVRAYYRALDDRDFQRAWAVLSPGVRTAFGGYERWRAGFAATLTSRPTDIRVRGGAVELTLVARDRAPCGLLEHRFAVRWRLDGRRAAAVAATRIGVPRCSAT